jgi:MFS family permease
MRWRLDAFYILVQLAATSTYSRCATNLYSRVNIANAAVFNLKKELSLTSGQRYNNCLVIFFIPYILLEIPSNLLLKRFKPHVWLSGCMFLFGLVSICQGLVSNYGGLLTTRFFLGVAESGMFPGMLYPFGIVIDISDLFLGCFYLISMWYKRSEAQRRYSFFFSSTTLAGAFGGLLASAIGKMSGMRGYAGWRWIFILEGVLTCVVAIMFFWVLPDFPEGKTART